MEPCTHLWKPSVRERGAVCLPAGQPLWKVDQFGHLCSAFIDLDGTIFYEAFAERIDYTCLRCGTVKRGGHDGRL